MRQGLLHKTNKVFIVSGIAMYLILMFYWHFPHVIYNALILFNFASFALVIYNSLTLKEHKLTTKRLAATVFVFSLVFVFLYLLLSYYYTGNTFVFSEDDARLYEELSYRIKDIPNKDKIYYLEVVEEFAYDDWGAPIVMSYLLKIAPSKEFVNLIYIILNTISACMLFSIGKTIMERKYAYTGSLVYSISSYTIFFMGSYLKEILLLFLVISCFYCLYRHKNTKHFRNIVLGIILSGLILFFRPAVSLGIWLSYLAYYMFVEKRKVLLIFISIFGIILLYVAFRIIIENYNRFSTVAENNKLANSLFNQIVFALGGLIGPLPHLLQTGNEVTYKPLYGSGLMYKVLLFAAFWKGAIGSIRKRDYEVMPLIVFVVVESLGLIVALDSLELRKAMPHIPFFIMVAFWSIYKYDSSHNGKVTKISSLDFTVCMTLAIGLILAWNILV